MANNDYLDYLAHYRTPGSVNGVSNTPGYDAVGKKAMTEAERRERAKKLRKGLKKHRFDSSWSYATYAVDKDLSRAGKKYKKVAEKAPDYIEKKINKANKKLTKVLNRANKKLNTTDTKLAVAVTTTAKGASVLAKKRARKGNPAFRATEKLMKKLSR